jgi:drug/metabolite transporter (DMT)-like permease
MLVAIVLWVKYWLAGDGSEMHMSTSGIVFLLLAAGAMGFGYAAWNVGILGGNVTLLAGASYFIPVFSAALSAVLLHAPLSFEFWQGAAMVCGGSILCWIATRTKRARPGNAAAVDTAE